MTRYYRDVVTLEVHRRRGRHRHARARGPAHRRAAPRAGAAARRAGSAGLFHTAILFETQEALAAALYSVASHAPATFTGSADHLVSQAFYFTDPEGNGIELYWDRARTDWSWTHGQVEMATLFLDPNRSCSEHLTEQALAGADGAGCGIRRSRASVGRGCRDRTRLLRRRPGVRRDGGAREPGGVRERRRLPPPHGDERLELPRRRAPDAGPRASDASTSPCPTPTRSARSRNACATMGSRCATTGARSRSRIPGTTRSTSSHRRG